MQNENSQPTAAPASQWQVEQLSNRRPSSGGGNANPPCRLLAMVAAASLLLPVNLSAGGPHGSLTFHSTRDGNAEIYRSNPDGSLLVRVTDHAAADLNPDITRNGRVIVFNSNRSGNHDIHIVSANGGEPLNLTNHPALDAWARWSPNDRLIAFHSNRDGNFEIYVMNADGSGLTRVTDYPGDDLWPDWSPCGKKLVFRRDIDLYVLHLMDGSIVRLTDAPPLNQMAVWSPNGKQLAFMSAREGYGSVFLINADGSNPINLTPKPEAVHPSQWGSRAPAWSANGRQIYFTGRRPSTEGIEKIFVMNSNGSGVTQLTFPPGAEASPRVR